MRLAIFGRSLAENYFETFAEFLSTLERHNITWYIYEPFWEKVQTHLPSGFKPAGFFSYSEDLEEANPGFLLSFGGDGTLLDSVAFLAGNNIPVLGINAGRLGFLSSTSIEEPENVIKDLKEGLYSVEQRSLLEFSPGDDVFGKQNFALNDFTIHKRDTSSMLTIHTYLDDELLNTYWSDGLIVATPTGSTAYSLSCGGPIVFPHAKSFVITPVASHNLTIRPIIVPDNAKISFEVEGRGNNFLISLDSRYTVVDYDFRFSVKKADICLNFVKLSNQRFISTLREKLMLGIDNRNS